MKKNIVIAALLLILSGCRTIQENVDIHTGKNTETMEHTQSKTGSSRMPIASAKDKTGYTLPKDYAEAYSYRNGRIDESIQNIPQNIQITRTNNPDEYIRQMSVYILKHSKNDFEKVKKAHDLVCTLVKYDADNLWKNTVPDQNWKDTLVTGRAVCAGYAHLFKKICDEIKIHCEIVNGYGRGVGTSIFEGETPAESNHAWNIVSVYNEHYLVDCTWDAGYMDGKISKQRYTTDWLFVKPEHFVYTHFPENPSQQLLKKTITAGEFITLPFLKPKYFELIETAGAELKKINHAAGKFILEYTVKDGYEITFTLYNKNSGKKHPEHSFTQFTGETYKTYFSFPEKGTYLITLFWKKTGEDTGRDCGEFGVISSKGNTVVYPKHYSSSGKNIQLISPIEMPLEKGRKYDFKIKIDNKNYAALIYNKKFIQLEKNPDGIFFKELIIPEAANKMVIGIADTEIGRYEIVLEYSVK
ncbi:MAG: transglutaminase domain-containing protein [Treponema phagedenis]|uniref:transglutaminase domain-containing protein n=1 Tax=Treponema phagedenis TaxID=162 RepID=UPI0031340FE7